MERRQAIAWAGSIALFGCVSTLLLGSLAGGFGFNITQPTPTQAIGPGALPQPSEERPDPGSAQSPPVAGSPDPEVGPNDHEPAPASAGTPPAPDAAPDVDYPHAQAGYAKLSTALPLSQPGVTASSRNVPAPPREVDKPDVPAKKKPPAPIHDKAPLRDIPVVHSPKRAVNKPRPQDIEKIIRSKIRTFRSPGAHNGASVDDRLTGAGPKVEANGGKARGPDESHDG